MAFGSGLANYTGNSSLALAHGGGGGGGKMGGFGHRALELGGNAAISLASKNMPGGLFGVEALKPDLVGVALSFIGVVLLKNKKGGRTARALLFASLHATIGRYVYSPPPFLTSGVEKPAAPPPAVHVHLDEQPRRPNPRTVSA